MGIYSPNRFNGSVGVSKVNVGRYTTNDFGRIMYESECNDQALFEAILMTDFKEVQGLREGTILESELRSLNEASIREMISSLQERVKQFWQKIKKVFDNAITFVAAFIAKNGKAYVKRFQRIYAEKTKKGAWTGTEEMKQLDRSKLFKHAQPPEVNTIEKDIIARKSGDKLEKKDVVNAGLGELLGQNVTSADDYKSKVQELIFNNKNIKAKDIPELCKDLEGGSAFINALKDSKKRSENAVKSLGKRLSKAEREANSDNASDVIKNINVLVGAYENIISITSKTAIKAVQKNLANTKSVLSKILSDLGGSSDDVSSQNASAIFLNSAVFFESDADEPDTTEDPQDYFDTNADVPIDDETLDAVEAVLDDAGASDAIDRDEVAADNCCDED